MDRYPLLLFLWQVFITPDLKIEKKNYYISLRFLSISWCIHLASTPDRVNFHEPGCLKHDKLFQDLSVSILAKNFFLKEVFCWIFVYISCPSVMTSSELIKLQIAMKRTIIHYSIQYRSTTVSALSNNPAQVSVLGNKNCLFQATFSKTRIIWVQRRTMEFSI